MLVTLRVLDGADRGRVYENVPTPLTIGREEGNSVQLNDERISRFHVKIQEDDDKLVLTDLQSTNGTKVNGENIQLWILRFGDIVALGRTVLIVGSEEEIAGRLARLRGSDLSEGAKLDPEGLENPSEIVSLDFELRFGDDPDAQNVLHTLTPPELPTKLTPLQAAQVSELLQYTHLRIRGLIDSVEPTKKADRVTLEQRQWQNLLDLQARLAGYLRKIGEPDES